MPKSKLWSDNAELDLQLFKVTSATRLPNGTIPWTKVAMYIADGAFSWRSCRSRFFYLIGQGKSFCRAIEDVQAAIRGAPGTVEPSSQNQRGKSGHEIMKEEQDTRSDSDDDTTSSSSASESEEEKRAVPPAKEKSKKGKTKQNDNNAETRKERKKKYRRKNKASDTAAAASLPPSAAQVSTAGGSGSGMSNIAEIAQKEVLRAIGNALLQKVGPS